jgi:hypothetical protein
MENTTIQQTERVAIPPNITSAAQEEPSLAASENAHLPEGSAENSSSLVPPRTTGTTTSSAREGKPNMTTNLSQQLAPRLGTRRIRAPCQQVKLQKTQHKSRSQKYYIVRSTSKLKSDTA